MIHVHEPIAAPSVQSQTGEVLQRRPQPGIGKSGKQASRDLPARITRTASKQAYYIIRYLVDHDRRGAAYRAYAYFRWVDDRLDQPMSERSERLAFLARQQAIVACAYRREHRSDLTCEEELVADLIATDARDVSDDQPASGLCSYISNMMAVMAFDAQRRGRWVTEHELEQYTQHLAIAVTEAMHYFIGHDSHDSHGHALFHRP